MDGDGEVHLTLLVGCPGNSKKVIEQPEVVVNDVLGPDVVLKLEVLFLDDVQPLAAGPDAHVGEEEQLCTGIEGGEVQRDLVNRLQHTGRQFGRIEHQVKHGEVAHLVDDPLAHELADVLRSD